MSEAPIEEQQKNFLAERQKAYKRTFGGTGATAKIIMRDLKKFCRAEKSCFHADPRVHAVFEGRREVYLRIREHLDLDIGILLSKYTKGEE